jgi:hypothetical protein
MPHSMVTAARVRADREAAPGGGFVIKRMKVLTAWMVCALTATAAAGQSSITASVNAPTTLTCNSPATVSLTLMGYDSFSSAVDIMLVIDESGSVDNAEFQQERTFLRSFVQSRTVGAEATRFGLVTIGPDSRLILPLSSNPASAVNAVSFIVQRGGTSCIGCAVVAAYNELVANGRPGVARMIVMLTDGNEFNPTQDLTQALQIAKDNGVIFLTVGLEDANQNQVTAIASTIAGIQTAFFSMAAASASPGLAQSVQSILSAGSVPTVTGAVVTLTINPAFLAESATASDGAVTLVDDVLHWSLPTLGGTATTLTFSVRAVMPGTAAVPLFTTATFQDDQGDVVSISDPMIGSQACPQDPEVVIQQLTADLNACTAAQDRFEADVTRLTGELQTCSAARTSLETALTGANAANATLQDTINTLQLTLQQQGTSLDAMTVSVAKAVQAIENYLRQVLRNPSFTIPGATLQAKLDNIVKVIVALTIRR